MYGNSDERLAVFGLYQSCVLCVLRKVQRGWRGKEKKYIVLLMEIRKDNLTFRKYVGNKIKINKML